MINNDNLNKDWNELNNSFSKYKHVFRTTNKIIVNKYLNLNLNEIFNNYCNTIELFNKSLSYKNHKETKNHQQNNNNNNNNENKLFKLLEIKFIEFKQIYQNSINNSILIVYYSLDSIEKLKVSILLLDKNHPIKQLNQIEKLLFEMISKITITINQLTKLLKQFENESIDQLNQEIESIKSSITLNLQLIKEKRDEKLKIKLNIEKNPMLIHLLDNRLSELRNSIKSMFEENEKNNEKLQYFNSILSINFVNIHSNLISILSFWKILLNQLNFLFSNIRNKLINHTNLLLSLNNNNNYNNNNNQDYTIDEHNNTNYQYHKHHGSLTRKISENHLTNTPEINNNYNNNNNNNNNNINEGDENLQFIKSIGFWCFEFLSIVYVNHLLTSSIFKIKENHLDWVDINNINMKSDYSSVIFDIFDLLDYLKKEIKEKEKDNKNNK